MFISTGQPGYGSGLIFELRKHSEPEPFVHLYYANVINNNEIVPLALNESETFKAHCSSWSCPLSGFAKGLETYILKNNDAVQEACKSQKNQAFTFHSSFLALLLPVLVFLTHFSALKSLFC